MTKGSTREVNESKGKVTVTKGDGLEQFLITGIQSEGEIANVGISYSRTVNTGNYESVRFGVDIHMPSGVTQKELTETFEMIKGWAEDKMAIIGEEVSSNFDNS